MAALYGMYQLLVHARTHTRTHAHKRTRTRTHTLSNTLCACPTSPSTTAKAAQTLLTGVQGGVNSTRSAIERLETTAPAMKQLASQALADLEEVRGRGHDITMTSYHIYS